MKNSVIFIILINFSINVNSQIISEGSMAQFLFPNFSNGKVLMRNGDMRELIMNYNSLTEKIVYKQNDKYFDFINQDIADTIFIIDTKFISYSGILYQVLSSERIPCFVHYKGTLLPPGTPAGYGVNSQVSNTKLQTSFNTSSGTYNLELPKDYKVQIDLVYSLIVNDMMLNFSNKREFLKIFPGKADLLNQFIKKNKIMFDNASDVENLAHYLNTILS
jgi:hypothetical protein